MSLLWLRVLGRAATLFTTEPTSLELHIMNFPPLGARAGSRTGLGADPQAAPQRLSLSLLPAPGVCREWALGTTVLSGNQDTSVLGRWVVLSKI